MAGYGWICYPLPREDTSPQHLAISFADRLQQPSQFDEYEGEVPVFTPGVAPCPCSCCCDVSVKRWSPGG